MTSPTPQHQKTVLPWLVAACLPLLGWWTYGLFDLDEGFYAAVVAEMNRRGEWITPYYNGQPWFEKPILLYWLAKPCLAIFGEMVGPRLPSVLATIATVWLIFWFLRRRAGETAAVWGALIYGTSLLVVGTGRMMLTDPLLVLFLTGTLVCYWESLCPLSVFRGGELDKEQPTSRENGEGVGGEESGTPPPSGSSWLGGVGVEAWRVLAAASLGLAVLAKGPVACILFALVAGLAYWRLPDRRKAYRGGWLLGTIVFLAIVASWYVPAYLANGNLFVRKFLIEQNIGRFTGGDAAHSIGLWGLLIYPLVLLVGMFPWSIWGIKASGRRREVLGFKPHASRPTPHHFTTYLKVWFWVVFVFFTISGAKLPHYILPAVPPLAMLIAMRLSDKRPGWPVLAWVAAVWAIAQAGFSLYYYGGFGIPGFHVEVHRIARFVAASKEDMGVAVYKMGRQTKDMGTGKPKIQETSHPSILLYLNGYGDGTVIDTDQFGEILHRDEPYFVITRWNRIGPEEQNLARIFGKSLMRVETPFKQDLYALYEVRPK